MAHDHGRAALIASGIDTIELENDESSNYDRFDLKNFERVSVQDVAISALSPGLYLRQSGTNAAHVQLLIDAAGSSDLPPILVQEQGWRVIDGLHRLEAAKLRGDATIKARFLDCTDSEALVLAIKSNTSHGLPLSKADRVSGAKRVLAAHPDWSDRAIAGITGLSPKTIASMRSRSGAATHAGTKRLGRDGRRRPVSAEEGRRRAAEYINAHPNASLRQVARETDVSLGTVHDVSARLRRGVSPERNGHRLTARRIGMHPPEKVAEPAALAPPAGNPPARRKNHTDVAPTWPRVAAKVANDPTIRYTEGGKEFLRWMAMHATAPNGWREFVSSIPVHWLGVIAPIADDISKEWSLFAERLKNKQDSAR
jgi:hypothetical protein